MAFELGREPAAIVRKGIWRARLLLSAMALVSVGACCVSLWLLYRAALASELDRLEEFARSQAALVDAVARFDAVQSQDADPAGAWVATLSQLADAQRARRANSNVSFLILFGSLTPLVCVENGKLYAPGCRPLSSDFPQWLARQALSGDEHVTQYESGHRRWLVASERIPTLGMAVVTRLDADDVRRPLLRAVAISAGAALLVLALGLVFLRRTNAGALTDLRAELARRVAAEADLAKHLDRLELTVAERTRELERTQAELLEHTRLATLGQVTAKVSHELRTPLATLRASLFTLREVATRHGLDLGKALERCERSVARSDRIIAELLAYTRPRPEQRTSVDVSRLLRELLEDYFPPPEVELSSARVEPDVSLCVDPEDLRRIVLNLLSNAVDASRAQPEHAADAAGSQKLVELALERAASEVVLRVQDSGVGMTPDVLSRAFEPLFSTKGFGVGLGLPIVRELTERNGGRLELESRAGQGTLVTLHFAVAKDEPA